MINQWRYDLLIQVLKIARRVKKIQGRNKCKLLNSEYERKRCYALIKKNEDDDYENEIYVCD